MAIRVEITAVDNGFIVEGPETAAVFGEEQGSRPEALRHALYEVLGQLGELGSRHDEHRIYIEIRPGDKHPAAETSFEPGSSSEALG